MGERSVRQSARRAALDAQAGQRRERQERDRRIDALAVEVLVALGERDAAERRAGQLLQTMIDREQLSLRHAVAWLGDPITVRTATRLLELAHSGASVGQPQRDQRREQRVAEFELLFHIEAESCWTRLSRVVIWRCSWSGCGTRGRSRGGVRGGR